MTSQPPIRKSNVWRLLQQLLLAGIQALTLRIQIKGMPRILYALRRLFMRPDETYRVYRNLEMRIDNNCESVYQWWNVVNYGGFEIVLLAERLLREGDIYIDVGANIGFMSLNAATVAGVDGRVLAIEPEPRVREKLLFNVKLNCANNVTIIPRAISDKIGTAIFSVATEEGLSRLDHGLGDNPCMVLFEKIEVSTTTLDSLIEEFVPGRPIRLIKMDVEGFEYSVFKGAHRLLQRAETIFIFESNSGALLQNGRSLVDIHVLLTAENYDVFAIRGHTADWFRIGRFPSFQQVIDASAFATANLDVIAVPRALRSILNDITLG